ncbi:tripartite tricarboxylate transporter substrate binding protein [Variovorax sp. LjRoot84]|uniref:Bug family tripartite tricarboxylate transporter substrate binding protein n=1 Tax=Variovorax sp. LjRoot84 TaxID=3342340 RepID=UPI003ED08448
MRHIIQAFALAVCLSCDAAGLAFAQTYPAKPVRMVVPFPPGGAADLIGRVLAHRLSEQVGQPVIVDNRAGASGNIGAEAVAKAQGDGYTILMGALTSHSINHTLERKVLRYDLERDLSPVMIVATVPYVLVVHPSVPAQSMQEFIAYARAKPGHLTYGSSGAGAPQRLAAEMFKLKTGIHMLHVPYKGSGQVINDLIGGQVLAAFESVPAALPHIRGGRLRALAVTTTQRIPMLPDVPTVEEVASFTFEASSTFGILAPAGTPKAIIERLNSALADALQFPDVKERLLQQGAFAESTTPEEAARRIRSEIAMWAKVINEAHIKPD